MGAIDSGPQPVINQTHYKRLIVKSPCFNVKTTEKTGVGYKRLFACGTQLGQIYIANVDEEPTEDHAKIYYYKQRYYSTTVFLDQEKESPRILLPEGKPFYFIIFLVETGLLH